MPNRSIPPERRAMYTFGIAVTVLGLLLFGSVFVTFAFFAGDVAGGERPEFDRFGGMMKSSILRAVGGMALILVGGALQNVAARGAAGSGLVLDPQQARKDIEPWARMSGGVLKDTLDEAGLDLGKLGGHAAPQVDFADRLRKLHELYKDGVITEEEYLREKAEILAEN